jgi:hypothetical protein
MSMDDLEHWLGVLGVAATVSATCFVVSAAIYLKKKS